MKCTIRYCAPELINEPQATHSFQSDIWALGCLVYEVLSHIPGRPSADMYSKLLTDILPYSTALSKPNLLLCMMRGDLPAVLPSPVLSHDVNELLASCWKEPLQRPGALDFVRNFQVSQQLQSQVRLEPPSRQQSAQISRAVDVNVPGCTFFYGTLMEPAVIRRAIQNEGLHLQVCPAVLYVSPAGSAGVTVLKICPFKLTG